MILTVRPEGLIYGVVLQRHRSAAAPITLPHHNHPCARNATEMANAFSPFLSDAPCAACPFRAETVEVQAMLKTEKPMCSVLLKLNRRNGKEQWVLACLKEKGHEGSHESTTVLWQGDDR